MKLFRSYSVEGKEKGEDVVLKPIWIWIIVLDYLRMSKRKTKLFLCVVKDICS